MEVHLRKELERMKKADLKRENDDLWRDVTQLGEQLAKAKEGGKAEIDRLRSQLGDLRERWNGLVEAHKDMTAIIYPGSLAAQRRAASTAGDQTPPSTK